MSETEAGRPEEKAPESATDQAAVNPERNDSTSGTGLQVQLVPFYEDQIEAVQTPDGEVHAVPKRICENIGVNWKTQFRKLQRDPIYSMVMMTIETKEGPRETCVIPIAKVAFWVSGIQSNKVAPEVREKMKLYREECADVLDRHFRGDGVRTEDVRATGFPVNPEEFARIIGKTIAESMREQLVPLSNTAKSALSGVADLDRRVTSLEEKATLRPVEEEPYMTVYAYCQDRQIKTNKETNRLHTTRLKTIIERDNLNIVPRLIKIKDSLWPLYHWPVSFLDRYFSHDKNRDLAMRNRRIFLFGKPLDRSQAQK